MFDIITIGGATRDITFLTDRGKVIKTPKNLTEQSLLAFEYGSKIRSDEVYFNFGGGSCNTAANFAKLGLNVAVNCKIGDDDDGKSTIENLEKLGISAKLIRIDKKRRTGFSLVVVNKSKNKRDGGDRIIFVYKGASDYLIVREQCISQGKWLYLTSLAGEWEKSLETVNKVVKSGTKLAWNPGATQIRAGKNKLKNLLKNTTIFIVNKDEAIDLVKSDKNIRLSRKKFNDPVVLMKIIKKWGPKIVVITDGPKGAYLYSGSDKAFYSPATSKNKIDSTGAGDAFGSTLTAGYILTGDIETALKFGVINSGNVVSEYGAQNGMLNRREIEKRLDGVKVSWL